jgi:hypothetical protein
MPNPNPGESPKIELDLPDNESVQPSSLRRGRPIFQEPMPAVPKIEPVLGETDIGSDEAERTVGIFFIVSAIPGVISLLLGYGAGGILNIAIPIYLGVGLLRGDDFVHQWVFAACLAQLVISAVVALAFPHTILFAAGAIAQNGGLLALVSGRAFSKFAYRFALGAVILGTLVSLVGAISH